MMSATISPNHVVNGSSHSCPPPQLCCDKGQALGAAKSLHVNAPGPVTSEPKCSPLASRRDEIPSFSPYFTKGVAVSLSSSLPLSVFF